MSKIIKNLLVFVASLILVLSFGSCMPEPEVEKSSEELETKIGSGVGIPSANPISANERGYFSTSTGKAVKSDNTTYAVFGADFGYLHNVNWKYPIVVQETTSNFDVYPLELNHEVVVAGLRSTMKMYAGRTYDVCFKWYNPDNEKVFQYDIRTADAGDYGYDYWYGYDFISWIGFCGWEILENGIYQVEITLKKTGSSSYLYSVLKSITVEGAFTGPDNIGTPHLDIGSRYRSDGWHYYTNYPDGIYNSSDDKVECDDGTFYYRSTGTLYHYKNGSGALVLDGAFTAYDTISALGGVAASSLVAKLAAQKQLAKELWYYAYKAYDTYGKIKLWGTIPFWICLEIESIIDYLGLGAGDVEGAVHTEYNSTQNRQEFTMFDINSSTGERYNETRFAYDYDYAIDGIFPYYDLPDNDDIDVNVPSNATGTVEVSADVPSYIDSVKFYINGSYKSTDSSYPYNYLWNTTTYPNGSYTLKAKGFDNDGNWSSSSSETSTVNNSSVYNIAPLSNGGTITKSSGFYNPVENSVDTNLSNYVVSVVDGNHSITRDFGSAFYMEELRVKGMFGTPTFKVSNNNVDWTEIGSFSFGISGSWSSWFAINGNYRYVKLEVSEPHACYEIEIMGN